MIKQIRGAIHHLGDQIIWANSEIAKGTKHFRVELTAGVLDLFPDITYSADFIRYDSRFELNYSVKFIKFDVNKFKQVNIPNEPYITIQFDSSCIGLDASTHPEAKVYVLDPDWQQYITNYYSKQGFKLVDIGSKRYTLQETAYIMHHSKGHVGASSAFGVFSRCVGVPFTHIYYNCDLREMCKILPDYMSTYGHLFSLNGMEHYFRDPNFNLI
jgi:hypothetical protein